MAHIISVFSDDDFFKLNPDAKNPINRVTKVELFHLDGTTSEMKLTFPIFTYWGDAHELTYTYLKPLIFHWVKYWLKIKAFKVSIGSIDEKGVETYDGFYPVYEIPLNKVWMPDTGEWVEPFEAKRQESETRIKAMIKGIASGRYDEDITPDATN